MNPPLNMQQTRNHPNLSCRSLYHDFTEPLTRSNARFSVLQIESVRQCAKGYFGKFQIFIGNLPQTRRTSSTRPSAIGAQAYGRVTPSSYPCIQRCMKFNVNVKSLIPAGKDHITSLNARRISAVSVVFSAVQVHTEECHAVQTLQNP